MGAKKKKKDGEAEEEAGGRGKRTKKPSNKWAMSGICRRWESVFDLHFIFSEGRRNPGGDRSR